MVKTVKITRGEYESYVNCQMSGVTNMFDIKNVRLITCLSKSKILYIMEHYSELKEKYLKLRGKEKK